MISSRKPVLKRFSRLLSWERPLAASSFKVSLSNSSIKVEVEHFTDKKPICAFHGKTDVTFTMWETMIERRVIPKTQVDAEAKMAAIGITEYDPYKIIEKTHGQMVHDAFEIIPR